MKCIYIKKKQKQKENKEKKTFFLKFHFYVFDI